MPKVRVLSRNPRDYTRERKTDVTKVYKNVDPELHPFEKAREYKRALNAVKLDRMFAKPFLGQLDGHADGVYSMCTVPTSIIHMVSGACDGEIRLWDLTTRATKWRTKAHTGFVRGLCCEPDGRHVISCGNDQTVKIWPLGDARAHQTLQHNADSHDADPRPLVTMMGASPFTSIDHHRTDATFVTGSVTVDLWDKTRVEPVHSFSWGCDSVNTVRYNPVERHVLASTGTDRSIILYDVRQRTPIRKVVLRMASNALCWNPMEAFNFTVANEDTNCYTFDMRKLETALCVHEDHVAAVMSVDYCPTGKSFVTGSYDRTVRIFKYNGGRSHEVYHSKRMQKVFTVKYSLDSRYILTGSDEFNIRLWKAEASARLGALSSREKNKLNYLKKLKKRFEFAPEVRRIAKYRSVPKAIKSAQRKLHIIRQSTKEKDRRRRLHSKPDSIPHVPARQKRVVGVQE